MHVYMMYGTFKIINFFIEYLSPLSPVLASTIINEMKISLDFNAGMLL